MIDFQEVGGNLPWKLPFDFTDHSSRKNHEEETRKVVQRHFVFAAQQSHLGFE